MNRYKKLGSNILWMLLGNFASKVLNFLLIPLYTNCLTTADYGVADLITTTITLLIPLLSLSIGEAVLRFALDYEQTDLLSYQKNIFSVGVYVSFASVLFLFICTPLIMQIKGIREYYWYFFLYFFTQVIYVVLAQFAKGIDSVFAFSLWGSVNTFATAGLNILFILFFKWKIQGYLLAFIIGQFLTNIGLLFHIKAHRYVIIPNRINKAIFKSMIAYSLPMIPNNISWWISNSSNRYIVTAFCGNSENGIYSIASKIPAFITVIFNMFIMAWQISSVENFGSKESQKFFSTINKSYISLCAIMTSGLITFIKPIAKMLFAKDFFVAWKIAPILIVACCFHSLALFLGTIYTAGKQTRKIFKSTVGAACLNIILNIALVPFIGSFGAALSTLISYFALWLFRVFESKNLLKIEYDKISSILSALLIVLQTTIVCCDFGFAPIISIIILLLVCVLNINFFRTIFSILLPFIKNKKKTMEG